jgi:WD40 repeat protein
MKAGLLAALSASLAAAASPTAWEMTSYQDFLKAKFSGLALSRDGQVALAPKLDTLFEGEQAVWSIAAAPDGSVYLGTGHKGKLVRVDRAGKSSVVFTAGEAEIFAVAVDAAGRVYAGTSPAGKVYRIEANGAATEYFNPNARYIWSLAAGKDGALYVGTGDEGKIFRVTGAGQGELFYETGQAHVTALAWDRESRLLAGSEPNGLVYRITATDRAFVLHDAALPEIRSIVAGPDGSIYVAAMGGSVSKQTTTPAPAAGAAQVSSTFSTTATVTVTDEGAAAQGGIEKPKPTASQTASSTQTATAAPAGTAPVEYAGVEKAAVYKIHPDNTVDTLWSSKEENVYDIALQPDGSLLIGADNQGRVYEVDASRKARLIADTHENEVLRLLASPAGALVATGTQGRLLRLATGPGPRGELESPVHDSTAIARWGKLSWQAAGCSGCALVFRTRSGNSARPDKTWSDWSEPLTDGAGSTVASPNARYTQWKAEFAGGAGGGSPSLDWVRLAYLPQNTPPSLKSLTISAQTSSAGSRPTVAVAATTPTYSITVTDTGEAGASSATGTPVQPLVRASLEQLTLSWLAEDPDNDKLIYSVWFRGDQQKEWKLLRGNMSETLHLVDAEAFADGRYWFRVTVSDRLSNPAPTAREDEIISAAILIDRTPPVMTTSAAARRGTAWEGRVDVKDAGSPLRACEYAIDGGAWTPLAPVDGVIDSMAESFVVHIDNLPAGEHLIAVRAYDSANNAGVTRFLVQ